MKSFNKLPVAILAGIVVSGCPSTQSRPDGCGQITVTAYLPPVVADLDYKDIMGSRNQVIVLGGFQHALFVPEPVKVLEATATPQLQFTDNAIPETETILFEFDHASIPASELDKLNISITSNGLAPAPLFLSFSCTRLRSDQNASQSMREFNLTNELPISVS